VAAKHLRFSEAPVPEEVGALMGNFRENRKGTETNWNNNKQNGKPVTSSYKSSIIISYHQL